MLNVWPTCSWPDTVDRIVNATMPRVTGCAELTWAVKVTKLAAWIEEIGMPPAVSCKTVVVAYTGLRTCRLAAKSDDA